MPRNPTKSLYAAGALLGALTAGCMSAPAPIPQDNFYRLSAPQLVPRYQSPVLDGSLFVELPRAAGLRRSRALLYSDDPDQLRMRQYHYHHWEEPPARLLQRRLADALREAGVAESVSTDRRFGSDYLLRTELRRFDRVMTATGSEAQVELNARLATGRRGEWRFERSYRQSVAADASDMNATITAFSQATDRVIVELLTDLQGIADEQGFAQRQSDAY